MSTGENVQLDREVVEKGILHQKKKRETGKAVSAASLFASLS